MDNSSASSAVTPPTPLPINPLLSKYKPPILIACGYRTIPSRKAPLERCYPLFLIRSQHHLEQKDGKVSYIWKSKRDFLVLHRIVSSFTDTIQFPKSALAKLAGNNAWRRPTLLDDENNDEESLRLALEPLPYSNSCIVSLGNSYHPRMKKSIRIIDWYFEKIHSFIHLSKITSCDPLQTHWNDFWLNAPPPTPKKVTSHNPSKAASLGQYFMHTQNMELVVLTTLKYLVASSTKSVHASSPPYIFLEPSCGDGRLLNHLLSALKKGSSFLSLDSCCFIGYDVDREVLPPQC